jgi:X-X-X-Leu-X-X-Gly heptad repeat protein
MISVAAGLRIVNASNTYTGSIANIKINPNYPGFGFTGTMVSAPTFFTTGATTLNTLAAGATQLATGFGQLVAGGGGSLTIAQAVGGGFLTQAQADQAALVLGAAGLSPAQIGAISIAAAQGTFTAAAPGFTAQATEMGAYAAMTQDLYVDAEQSGTGFTPVISVNVSPSEKLNIAVRYEFKTSLELTTKVNDNKGGGIFTNGTKVIADMPAMLAVGADYKITDNFLVTGSMAMFFDKGVDYDGSKTLNLNKIDKNSTEFALGAQYGISEKLRVSAGWMGTVTGANANYQSDQTYSANTNTLGGGIGYRISPKIDLNIGGMYTMYKQATRSYNHVLDTTPIPVVENYNKKTWIVAAGLDFYFGK